MIGYRNEAVPTPCEPGVIRRILNFSEELMMCEITFEKGAKGKMHSHPHLQITYVGKGSFEFTIAGKTDIVHQGDSVYIPSECLHGVLALEDGILVDVFNPKRDDFLK